jgi:hypothetical protein
MMQYHSKAALVPFHAPRAYKIEEEALALQNEYRA